MEDVFCYLCFCMVFTPPSGNPFTPQTSATKFMEEPLPTSTPLPTGPVVSIARTQAKLESIISLNLRYAFLKIDFLICQLIIFQMSTVQLPNFQLTP